MTLNPETCLHEIGVAGVSVTADPAFNLRPDLDRAGAILSRLCPDRSAPLVAICLRNWMVDGPLSEWEGQVARALDAFVERTGAFAVFVPFQAQTEHFLTDDVGAADRVMSRMARASRAAILRESHGPKALAGVLAGCDLVVGMRLHSLVFAASAGVPVVGLVYDPKVASLMTRLGVEQYALALTEVAGLGERMSAAWARRDAIRADLAVTSADLRHLAASNAGLAIGVLEGHGARTVSTPAGGMAERLHTWPDPAPCRAASRAPTRCRHRPPP